MIAQGDVLNGFLLLIFVAVMYFIPVFVAHSRSHHQIGAIAVINTLLGWTFIGWVVALAMACSAVKEGGAR